MDENQGCPSTLPGRVQLPDNKGAISIQSPLHPKLYIIVETYDSGRKPSMLLLLLFSSDSHILLSQFVKIFLCISEKGMSSLAYLLSFKNGLFFFSNHLGFAMWNNLICTLVLILISVLMHVSKLQS